MSSPRSFAITLAGAMMLLAAVPAAAQPPGPGGDLPRLVAVWEPAYTASTSLAELASPARLAASGDALWLATDSEVLRYTDGVWGAAEPLPEAEMTFALAGVGEHMWAFGFEGRAWRRDGGAWHPTPPPTSADLYAATARDPDDVWAVGFDYTTEQGTIVHHDGGGFAVTTPPELYQRFLYSVAADGAGQLWAGGCTYEDEALVLLQYRDGQWVSVTPPDISGCVYDLSFAADGTGFAAAGTDLLRWDGTSWQATGQAPPEGYQWVRVAAVLPPEPEVPTATAHAYAVAGSPTWRGYEDGQPPYAYDGGTWQPVALDEAAAPLLNDGAGGPDGHYIDLTTDGQSAWTISIATGAGLRGQPVLLELTPQAADVAHPRLWSGTDLAATDGVLLAGGQGGPDPLLEQHDGRWRPAASTAALPSVAQLDMANGKSAWAVTAPPTDTTGPPEIWRWDGRMWAQVTLLPEAAPAQVRALPDGGAWVTTTEGDLISHTDGRWSQLLASEPRRALFRRQAEQLLREYGPDVVPYDAVTLPGGARVGWIALGNQLCRILGDRVTDTCQQTPARVVDVQLADPRRGYAVTAPPAGRRAQLLTLRQDDDATPEWTVVDDAELTAWLRRIASNTRFRPSTLRWTHSALVGPDEIWLAGEVSIRPLPNPLPVIVRQLRGHWQIVGACRVDALTAAQASDTRLESDVWVMTTDADCDLATPITRDAPSTGDATARTNVLRLRLRALRWGLWLPVVAP